MKKILLLIACVLVACTAKAADTPPYKEGPVISVTYIKVKPGQYDAYIKWLGTERKALYDAYKAAGLILDYRVYDAFPKKPSEPDLILTETYPNFAALDDFEKKTAAIDEKVAGSRAKSIAGAVDREKLREVLGGELIREVIPN